MTAPSAKRIVLFLLGVLALAPGVPGAHLPVAVGGQPLPSLAPIIDQVAPAVVDIATEEGMAEDNPFRNHPFYKHFFGQSTPQKRSPKHGLGSGVILDAAKGYIVTNHHVIAQRRHRTLDGERLSPRLSGVRLGGVGEGSPYLGKVTGVVVLEVRPNSPAARAGRGKGDVIRSINRQPVGAGGRTREGDRCR